MVGDQAFEHGSQDIGIAYGTDDVGIERFWLAAVAEQQNSISCRPVDLSFAFAAGANQ